MSVCHLSNCDYVIPENYNPQYGLQQFEEPCEVHGYDQVDAILRNCLTIYYKQSFYVGSDKTLQGYSWYNIPGRIFLWIKNWYSGGTIDANAVRKIEETFEFILGIRKMMYNSEGEYLLRPTCFHETIKFYKPYTDLAKKMISQYSRKDHPNLYYLAHRIIHERFMWIPGKKRCRNISEEAKGYPFEKTTVWDKN